MAHVLLVESEATLGKVLGWYLLEDGFQVSRVANPEDVAAKLGAEPAADLILFNTGLPTESKSVFIRSWRELAPEVRVLEVSEDGFFRASQAVDLSQIGFPDAFVNIPIDWSKLPDE